MVASLSKMNLSVVVALRLRFSIPCVDGTFVLPQIYNSEKDALLHIVLARCQGKSHLSHSSPISDLSNPLLSIELDMMILARNSYATKRRETVRGAR